MKPLQRLFYITTLLLLVNTGYSQIGSLEGITSYCIDSVSVKINADKIPETNRKQIRQETLDEIKKLNELYQGPNLCLTNPNYYLFTISILPITNLSGTLGYAVAHSTKIYKYAPDDKTILRDKGPSVMTTGTSISSLKENIIRVAREDFESILLEIRKNNTQNSTNTTQVESSNQTVPTIPAPQPETPSNSDLIQGTIEGRFTGLDGATTITLTNGQQWQQIDATTSSYSANSPSVTIRRHGAFWKMKVDGVSEEVTVMRLQ